ncbi:MAG: signal peptidase I [Planctomycetota bacterium]
MYAKIQGIRDLCAGNLLLRWLTAFGLAATCVGLGIVYARLHASGTGGPENLLILAMLAGQIVAALAIAFGSRLAWIVAQYFCGIQALWNVVQFFRSQNASPVEANFGDAPFHVAFAVWFIALWIITFLGLPAVKTADTPEGAGPEGNPDFSPGAVAAPRKKGADPLEWTRDNIEAIAVAFLMALIIRCFCIEVFKIPTGSMEPTLFGDTKAGEPPPAHTGDRIMVDKLGLILHGVKRYDVCVFKYPLDRSRNFIKRIVGLPEEDFRVDHADIWTRPHSGGDGKFHLARKPAREQASIWLHAWPGEDVSAEKCKKMWDGAPAGCYAGGATFDTGPANGEAVFRLQTPVKDYYRGKGTNARVNDLAIRFKATMAAGAELFVTNARSDGYGRFTTSLSADGTVRFSHMPDEGGTFAPLPAPTPAPAGAVAAGADVEIAQWDGAIRVRVSGREVASWEYVDLLPDKLRMPDAPAFQMSFGSRGGAVKFQGVWIGRDILYNEAGQSSGESVLTGQDHLSIPKDSYFAIGDNVCNSKDGRLWKERIVRLKSGLTIHGDGDSPENYPQNRTGETIVERFRDLEGTDHFFKQEDVEDEGDRDKPWHPFVAREELVGKALVVWYPFARFKMIR